jgi:dihydrofolate reductase
MGKIRFFFAASLDGYIADPSGSVDFLDDFDEDHGYSAFIADIGTLVMGRDTYDFVESYGSWPYGEMPTIVLTHRIIERPLGKLETRVVDDISAFARELRERPGGDVWIAGGGKVMGEFLAAGEADTIQVTIVPVAIGTGKPMYAGAVSSNHRYNLSELKQHASGSVRFIYERK